MEPNPRTVEPDSIRRVPEAHSPAPGAGQQPISDSLPAITERHRCPVCGSSDFEVLVSESFASPALSGYFREHYAGHANPDRIAAFNYELVRCRRCTLAYQRTVPGPALLMEIYDQWIPDSERNRLREQYSLDDYNYWAEEIRFLIRHFGRAPHAVDILDFGMGWAEWAAMAKAFGCNVAGCDFSQPRLEHARSLGIEVVAQADIGCRKFDFINTEQVFEHLLDPLDILRYLAGALSEHGILKISVPNSRRTLRILGRGHGFASLQIPDVMPVAPLEHVNCFEHRTLVTLGKMAGLRLLTPRLRLMYDSSSGWLRPRRAAKLLLRPIYRHWFPKSTFLYFVRDV